MPAAAAQRLWIGGLGFDNVDQDGAIGVILEMLGRGEGGFVVTPNVDILRQTQREPELAALVGAASLVIVDGAPVVWAGRLAGHPQVHRVAGASLVEPLAGAAGAAGVPVLLLGGRPGAADLARDRLQQVHPGVAVEAHCPPPGFEADPVEWAGIVEAVLRAEGGIVFCGFGFPKQERLMAQLLRMFPNTWFLGVGGSIDFLAGEVPRAPRWMQRIGFEWLFRLAVEPRRLARRYLVDDLPFAMGLLSDALRARWSKDAVHVPEQASLATRVPAVIEQRQPGPAEML